MTKKPNGKTKMIPHRTDQINKITKYTDDNIVFVGKKNVKKTVSASIERLE